MKKKVITATVLTGGLLIFGLGNSFANDNGFELFKTDINKAQQQNYSDYITINGEGYTKKEFDDFKANEKLFEKLKQDENSSNDDTNKLQVQSMSEQSTSSDDKIKDDFVKQKVLYDKAKQKDLDISEEQASNYSKEVRENLEKSENRDQMKGVIAKYQDALGVSEEEYWENLTPQYQELISIGKLKANFISEELQKDNTTNSLRAAQSNELSSTPAEEKEAQDDWEEYGDQLVKDASVEIKNN